MFLFIHSTLTLNLRNCVRIVQETNGHQLRETADLPRGFQTTIYPPHFDQNMRDDFELLCRILNRSYTESSRRVTLTSPWNGGPANRTCQPTQECCWCWCSCYELLLRHEPKTFPSSETGCLSVPCWTELYNWAWGHSSTSCHLAPTSRLPTGRTALALGTVQGIFTYLI